MSQSYRLRCTKYQISKSYVSSYHHFFCLSLSYRTRLSCDIQPQCRCDTFTPSLPSLLHRFLWEQKVAKKVKVCKLFSQLSSCTLFMGAKSCEKVWKLSLSTIIARSGAKVCKLFALQIWQKKVARRKKYRFGVRQNHELFSRVTQPIQSVVHNHTREPHTTHTTPNMDGHG